MRYTSDIAEERFTWCFTKPIGIILGALYNGYVITNPVTIAPLGFHIPTQAEWETLIAFIGGYEYLETLNSIGTDYWLFNNGTDDYGFTNRGSGIRYINGDYNELKISSYHWTSDLYTVNLDYPFHALNFNNGISIRCIKDDNINDGAIIDIDGNEYVTVTIGTQVWMGDNLSCTHFRDGTLIPQITGNSDWAKLIIPSLCYYNNNPLNGIH